MPISVCKDTSFTYEYLNIEKVFSIFYFSKGSNYAIHIREDHNRETNLFSANSSKKYNCAIHLSFRTLWLLYFSLRLYMLLHLRELTKSYVSIDLYSFSFHFIHFAIIPSLCWCKIKRLAPIHVSSIISKALNNILVSVASNLYFHESFSSSCYK